MILTISLNEMNKHQTLAYLKYVKLINEINDKITVSDIKSDMIKFLVKFPGNLKYPSDIVQSNREKYGIFLFKTTKPSKFLSIYFDGNNNFKISYIPWTSIDDIEYYVERYQNDFFDGNNNFKIWPYNKWPYYDIPWASIDDIVHYVDTHLDNFKNIIE